MALSARTYYTYENSVNKDGPIHGQTQPPEDEAHRATRRSPHDAARVQRSPDRPAHDNEVDLRRPPVEATQAVDARNHAHIRRRSAPAGLEDFASHDESNGCQAGLTADRLRGVEAHCGDEAHRGAEETAIEESGGHHALGTPQGGPARESGGQAEIGQGARGSTDQSATEGEAERDRTAATDPADGAGPRRRARGRAARERAVHARIPPPRVGRAIRRE